MRVERLSEADADRLMSLAEAFHGESGNRLGARQREAVRALLRDASLGRAWILAGEGGDLGYATCAFVHSIDEGGRMALLDDLYLAPPARGRGLGVTLLSAVEADLAAVGCRAVALMADRADGRAMRFYRRHGFAESPLAAFSKRIAP